MKLVDVAIALVWRGEELLITRRPDNTHLGGLWEFPGGKLGAGEDPRLGAEREVREEVGLVCRAERIRRVIEHAYSDRHVRLFVVDCEWQSGTPELLGVSDARWVRRAALSNFEFPAANATLLAELVAEKS